MKIKLINIAICGAVCSLSACSEADDMPALDPQKYITFSAPTIPFDYNETPYSRAELVDEITEFKVWGYCIPNDVNGNPSKNQAMAKWDDKSEFFTKGADVLNGFTVKVDGSNTSYNQNDANNGSTSNPKPWYNGTDHINANDYNYCFIAGSSTAGTFSMNDGGVAASAHPVLKFELPYTSNNIDTELTPEMQPDALVGKKFDQYNNSKVKLEFDHIMTGLRFRFHNQCTATADDSKDLVIHRVTFSGQFYKTAEFSFSKEEMQASVTGETYSGTFVLLNSDQTIAAGSSDLMRHEGNPQNRSVKLLLLPNPNASLDKSDKEIDDWALGRQKQIRIEYSIGNSERRTYTTDRDFRLSYIPDPNTLHTANFHFVGDDFVVVFQADNETNWENGSDSNLEIH
ncbi:MAG: fimbrillin family protein [Muribaculaceae bacterium]|nr:fimbrillin family protein [Muribaculaceae bacterium]